MPQKLIGNQLRQHRIEAFGRQVEQQAAETVQMFVQATISTMILVRQIAMFSKKVVLTIAIKRKKVQQELQIMFTGKVNHKEPTSQEAERQPGSHRGFTPIRKNQIRQLQTEEDRAEVQLLIHAGTIM